MDLLNRQARRWQAQAANRQAAWRKFVHALESGLTLDMARAVVHVCYGTDALVYVEEEVRRIAREYRTAVLVARALDGTR